MVLTDPNIILTYLGIVVIYSIVLTTIIISILSKNETSRKGRSSEYTLDKLVKESQKLGLYTSPIAKCIYETAKGLYNNNVINDKEFNKYTKTILDIHTNAVKDNPDLPINFIRDILVSKSQHNHELDIYKIIYKHFNYDIEKIHAWFNTPNILLGDNSPNDMIKLGRTKKLLEFINTQLEENK